MQKPDESYWLPHELTIDVSVRQTIWLFSNRPDYRRYLGRSSSPQASHPVPKKTIFLSFCIHFRVINESGYFLTEKPDTMYPAGYRSWIVGIQSFRERGRD